MDKIRHAALLLAILFTPVAYAQTFIVPEGGCGKVKMHVTSGSDFAELGEKIDADRLADAYVYLPEGKVAVKPVENTASLAFNADISEGKVVMAAVSLKPTVSGNEQKTEHAKALVFCGAITPTDDWQRSFGLAFEIYPQGWNGPRPKMKAGDQMRFITVDRTSKETSPLPDVPFELYRAGAGRIATGVADATGWINLTYPEPGRYMLVASHRRPDPQRPERTLVDTSTLTFDVNSRVENACH